MSVTKQEFLDILNTIGVRASNGGSFWNIGMGCLIRRMAYEARSGEVTLCRAEGEWTLEGDDSALVVNVVPAAEMMKY